jgi:hypothetical protein
MIFGYENHYLSGFFFGVAFCLLIATIPWDRIWRCIRKD